MLFTIQIKKSTKDRLAKLGNLNSTYDSVINDLIDHAQNCFTCCSGSKIGSNEN
jgi:hypothetical protein